MGFDCFFRISSVTSFSSIPRQSDNVVISRNPLVTGNLEPKRSIGTVNEMSEDISLYYVGGDAVLTYSILTWLELVGIGV